MAIAPPGKSPVAWREFVVTATDVTASGGTFVWSGVLATSAGDARSTT